MTNCILCDDSSIQIFYEDHSEHHAALYYKCENCHLIFQAPIDRPTRKEEYERYETHENDPEDPGYRNFLSQLFDPMHKLLESNSEGLDFGSGPGPTLNIMFEEVGHEMQIYDPFYADDDSVFKYTYDFITSTEVFEHLFNPGEEFEKLWTCLKPGGYLGIMTKIAPEDQDEFANWHYRLDETHVTFYTATTFHWMAKNRDANLSFHGDRVIIFQKRNG